MTFLDQRFLNNNRNIDSFSEKEKEEINNILDRKYYGNLTIINFIEKSIIVPNSNKYKYFFKGKCKCGREITVEKEELISGEIIECPICSQEKIYNVDKDLHSIRFVDNNYIIDNITDKRIRVLNDPRSILNKPIGFLVPIKIKGIKYKNNIEFKYIYECKCTRPNCNSIVERSKDFLLSNKNNHELDCGCTKYNKLQSDIINREYNGITVLEFLRSEPNLEPKRQGAGYKDYIYKCRCGICGKLFEAKRDDLISYHIKSCGCLRGLVGEDRKFANIYNMMINRCTNPESREYKYAGAKGINVDESWLDYNNFKRDMYDKYKKHCDDFGTDNTFLIRKELEKNYCAENCKWGTKEERRNNTLQTHYYFFNNTKYTINDLLKFCDPGISYELLKGRLNKCPNYCKNDTIINDAIFINNTYRQASIAKGLSFPIKYTTNVEQYKNIELPKNFEFHNKDYWKGDN